MYRNLKDISPFSMYEPYLDPDSNKQTIKKNHDTYQTIENLSTDRIPYNIKKLR